MREIKFRAWAKYGEMLPNVQNHINGDWAFGNMLNNPDEFKIMQYTGLRDANGVEIYEGDIISDHVGVGSVKYSDNYASFKVSYGDGIAKWFIDYLSGLERCSIEVIGNIYENPELLE